MKKLTILSAALLFVAQSHAQISKGDRILAYQVDMAENQNYDVDFGLAKDACMESIHFSSVWTSYEPNAGNYDANFIANFLDLIDLYMPLQGMQVELQIAPVNTNVLELPADLVGTPFNDPALIDRFKILLDTVFAHIPNVELSALNIGNESDIYFGSNATLYNEFSTFLDSIIPYAQQLYFNLHGTELKVGTVFTMDGLLNSTTANLCQSVNANRDIVALTYYPLEPNFHMEQPSVVATDFADLIAMYPNPSKPIYFTECGYASSATCSSSEAQQADFFTEVFNAWDTYYANIKYLTIFKTTDYSPADIQIFETYYGISDPAFLEYLRTLGVRTWNGAGTDKLGFERIKCELEARNWCMPLTCTANIDNVSEPTGCFFPNPATISIETPGNIKRLEIWSTDGRLVQSEEKPLGIIDVSNLVRGIYRIQYETEDGMHQTVFEKM